jgi:hypothetical protein
MTDTTQETLPERTLYLVMVPMGPTIWFAHFCATYATASLWCAPGLRVSGSLSGIHVVIAILTALALAGIGFVGLSGYRRQAYGGETAPHDDDTPQDRHRFLGLATMLLAGLSAVATTYVGISIFFFSTCGS